MTDLHAHLRSRVPALDVELDVPGGRTLGVIGPNGAGKSTLLNVLAGLLPGPGSEIRVGDRIIADGETSVPPHRRSIALLTQKPRLFPHLSVAQNVAYGPRASGIRRREAEAIAADWMTRTGVTAFADRRPAQLSGGQQQRVAIARALAVDPQVLLLDEPFAALDVAVAQEIRGLTREVIGSRDGATLVVTHDLIDVVTLADEVLVLEHGRAVDHGATGEVISRPGHPFTASLSGLNFLVGVSGSSEAGASVTTPEGITVIGSAEEGLADGRRAAAAFSPRAVAIYRDDVPGSPRNRLAGTVTEIAPRGEHAVVGVRVGGDTIDAEITWAAIADLGIGPGIGVILVVKATEIRVYGLAGAAR